MTKLEAEDRRKKTETKIIEMTEKVYIVLKGKDFENHTIVGVFDSEEKAKEYIAGFKYKTTPIWYEDYVVNPPFEDNENHTVFFVKINKWNNEVMECYKYEGVVDNKNCYISLIDSNGHNYSYIPIQGDDSAINKMRAEKEAFKAKVRLSYAKEFTERISIGEYDSKSPFYVDKFLDVNEEQLDKIINHIKERDKAIKEIEEW